ncbi:MAG: hypothetical protein ACI82A_003408, partial [Candidatus Azotimanducaceae bacterium]
AEFTSSKPGVVGVKLLCMPFLYQDEMYTQSPECGSIFDSAGS